MRSISVQGRVCLSLACAAVVAADASAQYPVKAPPPCNSRGRSADELAAAAPRPARRPLVVLPFRDESARGETSALATVFAEQLAERLGRVRPRTVGFRDSLQGGRAVTGLAAAALGKRLGATYVLAGRLSPSLVGLSLEVQLVKVADSSIVWWERYFRTANDLLAIEGEIVRAVAARAVGPLSAAQRAALGTAPTTDAEAYVHYLRGHGHFADGTATAIPEAVREYTEAAQRDAHFAPAWSRLAMSYALWLEAWAATPSAIDDKVLPAGLAAAATALEVNPQSSEAWLARAMLLERQHPRALAGAGAAYERAIDLDPLSAEAHRR